ncbi:hypothetical protein JXR93_14455 [bacterium]|nr:hypothetical protein [bacterium]
MRVLVFLSIFITTLLFGSEQLTNSSDLLQVISYNSGIIATGINNKGLYLIENGNKREILSDKVTIYSFIRDENGLIINTTDNKSYSFNGKLLKESDSSALVKMDGKDIYLSGKNGWEKITDSTDFYYFPQKYNDYILFSGLKKGLFLYQISTKTTYFIDKGNHAHFSANGNSIIFIKAVEGENFYTSSDIYIYNISTKKVEPLLVNSKIKLFPFLDGDKLYYQSNLNIFVDEIK